MKLYSNSSSTHHMANIILDDDHSANESEKTGGRHFRGSCNSYMVDMVGKTAIICDSHGMTEAL